MPQMGTLSYLAKSGEREMTCWNSERLMVPSLSMSDSSRIWKRECQAKALLQLPVPPRWAQLLTLSMSCFISEALSRVSSPSPVRQFTSWLRSSLFKVPSSSKSREYTEAQKDVVRMSSQGPGMTPALNQHHQKDHVEDPVFH